LSSWAELDDNNIVIRVIKGDDTQPDEGYSWIVNNLGGRWVKTSFNTWANVHREGGVPFRKNAASPGFYFDEERDAFIVLKQFPSWVLDEETCQWKPPIDKPTDGVYVWNEEILGWDQAPPV
jgi:hypothetical protein